MIPKFFENFNISLLRVDFSIEVACVVEKRIIFLLKNWFVVRG